MAKVRIGTFNVENLFLRYNLLDKERGSRTPKPVDKQAFLEKGGSILMLGVELEDFGPVSKSARFLTSRTILENDPDVLALQEVECLEALKIFNRTYLKKRYPYQIVIDGNDPRQIDVGLVSKFPIAGLRTHQFDPDGRFPRIFSRDALEVDLALPGGKTLTVLVNHFKSKIGGGEEKREKQATRVAEILIDRFGKKLDGDFVVCGDLNAGPDANELEPLLGLKDLENAIDRIPEDASANEGTGKRWTHYYKKGKSAEQLDYLLLSPRLSEKAGAVPTIERRGLPKDIDVYTGTRFAVKKGKKLVHLKGTEGASDHCPVFMDLVV